MEEGSFGFIVKEEVFLFKFISPLKLSNYFHHKWKAGCAAKIGLKLLSLMIFNLEPQSFLFGPSLEPVYGCTSVGVRKKPSRYGQDSIHGPQFVVCIVFVQFLDLDLRHT